MIDLEIDIADAIGAISLLRGALAREYEWDRSDKIAEAASSGMSDLAELVMANLHNTYYAMHAAWVSERRARGELPTP